MSNVSSKSKSLENVVYSDVYLVSIVIVDEEFNYISFEFAGHRIPQLFRVMA